MNTPITASELNIADQALENRFYVRGFAERVEDGKRSIILLPKIIK